MGAGTGEWESDALARSAATVRTLAELAEVLRQLRRRHARQLHSSELTYRELAAKTGWSQAAIWDYFAGKALPATDRFDDLVQLLGATPLEQGALATARDRVEERRRTAPPAPGRLVPRQLPAAARHIAGRTAELARLDALAAQPEPVLATIVGTAGIGKTALAVSWARRVAGRYPDGQLYANLRGFDPADRPADPAQIMRRFLEACAVPPAQLPADLDALAGTYRSVLAERRMLVLLDNAASAEQVRPLLPGAPGCLVLVTSRNRLPGLAAEGARAITLDLLTGVEARDLLGWHLGEERVAAGPDAVEEIISRCAGLPLALTIVAAQAATHPTLTLDALAGELRTARGVLDALDGGEPSIDVRAAFSWSYRRLSDAAARLFRLLGLHPGPDITAPAAASLAGVSRIRPALTELDRACLVTQHQPGRYASHDLLRTYATELAQHEDDREQATDRLLDHYLHTAHRAALLWDPHRDPITLDEPHPGTDAEHLADRDHAVAWFDAEQANLLALITAAAGSGRDRHTWQLAWTVFTHLHRQGHIQELASAQRVAAAAAARLGDSRPQAMTNRMLATAHIELGEFDEAEARLRQSLHHSQKLGDHTSQGHVHYDLAALYERQHRFRDALHHAQLAADLFADRLPVAHARTLNLVGWLHGQLGEYFSAITACEGALAELQRQGDAHGQAMTWDSLGYAYHHQGRYRRGIECYRQAVTLLHGLGNRTLEAGALIGLGDAYQASSRPEEARTAWHRAREIFKDLNHPDIHLVDRRLAGVSA